MVAPKWRKLRIFATSSNNGQGSSSKHQIMSAREIQYDVCVSPGMLASVFHYRLLTTKLSYIYTPAISKHRQFMRTK